VISGPANRFNSFTTSCYWSIKSFFVVSRPDELFLSLLYFINQLLVDELSLSLLYFTNQLLVDELSFSLLYFTNQLLVDELSLSL
jgi:hypothetical protein